MKAFPRADGKFNSSVPDEKGMDLRDYFAAKAMQGILSRENYDGSHFDVSMWAYDIADAMMKARGGTWK